MTGQNFEWTPNRGDDASWDEGGRACRQTQNDASWDEGRRACGPLGTRSACATGCPHLPSRILKPGIERLAVVVVVIERLAVGIELPVGNHVHHVRVCFHEVHETIAERERAPEMHALLLAMLLLVCLRLLAMLLLVRMRLLAMLLLVCLRLLAALICWRLWIIRLLAALICWRLRIMMLLVCFCLLPCQALIHPALLCCCCSVTKVLKVRADFRSEGPPAPRKVPIQLIARARAAARTRSRSSALVIPDISRPTTATERIGQRRVTYSAKRDYR